MCGIIGYIGPRETAKVLIEGLKRLEYRGYDSAGIAVFQKGRVEIRRKVGKLSNLEEVIQKETFDEGWGRSYPVGHGRPSGKRPPPSSRQSGCCPQQDHRKLSALGILKKKTMPSALKRTRRLCSSDR
jgi:glucosamine--fructose-6-phosphate aminotransferase (isomerizing)